MTEADTAGKKIVIFFGDGKFSPGGYAAVPRKPFIKELGSEYPTIITSEFRTSKICPKEFNPFRRFLGI